ncbi:MAG: PD-(D/E)XK nuclease family protein [Lachnospiraceae bacterium]|nr:PD-(D/E)XK nuclease family protein [Lachnospiraceae bacterium]
MKEQIYLAPGANGAELMKSLAMHGINSFNVRIVGAGELARLALMRCGISITEGFVSIREETALVAKATEGVSYFGKTTYSDIKDIAGAIRQMRSLVAGDDEAEQLANTLLQGIFKEKNTALISVYKNYISLLSDGKLLDTVSLIRKAIKECGKLDSGFHILKEYPLDPLQKALIQKLSGGNVKEDSIRDLFGIKEEHIKLQSIKNCYGAANEVETIITDIYKNHDLDKCTVAVTDPATYGQLFFDYALLYDLPITFGCGIPIVNSNPAKLLILYYRWMTGGFFGTDSINAMLGSESFDMDKLKKIYPKVPEEFKWHKYYDMLGNLRLTNDPEKNKKRVADLKKAVKAEEEQAFDEESKNIALIKKSCIPLIEVMAVELSLPVEEFIHKYARLRKSTATNAQKLLMMLDAAASEAIYEELKVIRAAGLEQDTDDIILNVLKLAVAEGRSEAGKLYVTGITGAMSSGREKLFIAGLSATKFPGAPKENYLLLDADIKLFGEEAEYMTSHGRIGLNRERLSELVKIASGLKSYVFLCYPGLNVSELKKNNASSMIYELFREANGGSASSKDLETFTEKISYFAPAISATRKIGEAYNDGYTVKGQSVGGKAKAKEVKYTLDKAYSPSAFDSFFNCPRAFLLGYILGIPQPDTDDPFEIIAANESGTLAHTLLRKLAGTKMSREEFIKLAGENFDIFLLENPPLVELNAKNSRRDFLEMMGNAYDMNPPCEVVLSEKDISCTHETGVKLHGFPDRVEKKDDGSLVIVDFKTKRQVDHIVDDIETCFQVMVYAYLMESNGYNVSGGEYRYIRLDEAVTCKYDDDMKQKISDKLEAFKKSLTDAVFPVSENALNRTKNDPRPDPCKYCNYGGVCGKTQLAGGDDYV